jgi:hypothetical protein
VFFLPAQFELCACPDHAEDVDVAIAMDVETQISSATQDTQDTMLSTAESMGGELAVYAHQIK